MGKRIPITPELTADIRRAVGDPNLDTANFAVFETKAISTEPVKQAGFFDGARVSHGTLADMAALLSKENKSVPLVTMHNREMMPIGRVFKAGTFSMQNGETELRSLFYVPMDKANFAKDIENALIDEVSVNVKTNCALCSECGFDFFGPDATFMNFVNMECGEGHTIGEDGTHLRLTGLDTWAELSLVARGAAREAKILAQQNQKLATSDQRQLAANGMPRSALMLTASAHMDPKLESKFSKQPAAEKKPMADNTLELANALGDERVKAHNLQASVATLTAANTALTADLAAAQKKITDLEAASKDAPALIAAKDKVEKELKDSIDLVVPHVKAALVASGIAEDKIPATLSEMIKVIDEKGLKLHQLVGAGGSRSDTSPSDAALAAKADTARMAAFKTKK